MPQQKIDFDKIEHGYNVKLVGEPTRVANGTMFPRSIFREKIDRNEAEKHLLKKIDPAYGKQTSSRESKSFSKKLKDKLLNNTT
jgi:hypothetical protein